MSRGVVYLAVGPAMYYEAACVSARSVKKTMPSVGVTLFTDKKVDCGFIDEVELIKTPANIDWQGAKIAAVSASPYDLTLLLDCDTWVCADLLGVFALVEDAFDIAVTHTTDAPGRFPWPDVPDDFPHYSSGMVIFKRNEVVARLLRDWQERFDFHKVEYARYRKKKTFIHPDQESLRIAMYHARHDLRVLTLRREYNCTYWAGHVNGKVKVLHVHGCPSLGKLRKLAAEINMNPNEQRLFWERRIIQRG